MGWNKNHNSFSSPALVSSARRKRIRDGPFCLVHTYSLCPCLQASAQKDQVWIKGIFQVEMGRGVFVTHPDPHPTFWGGNLQQCLFSEIPPWDSSGNFNTLWSEFDGIGKWWISFLLNWTAGRWKGLKIGILVVLLQLSPKLSHLFCKTFGSGTFLHTKSCGQEWFLCKKNQKNRNFSS